MRYDNKYAEVIATRRRNIKMLVDAHGSNRALALRLGKTRGYVYQLHKGECGLSERAARSIEDRLSLPYGWLDSDHTE